MSLYWDPKLITAQQFYSTGPGPVCRETETLALNRDLDQAC